MISSGLHDLDGMFNLINDEPAISPQTEILGGGVAVGTLLLIEEDVNTSHAKSLFKYFLREGVACEHSVFLASAAHPDEIVG